MESCPNGDVTCQAKWLDPDKIAFRGAYCRVCQNELLPDGWKPDPQRKVEGMEQLATVIEQVQTEGDLPEEVGMWLQVARTDIERALDTYHEHLRDRDDVY